MRMRYLPLVLVAVILPASCLFAQLHMGDMPREGSVGSTQMMYSSQGLFVLRTGDLARYDPAQEELVQETENAKHSNKAYGKSRLEGAHNMSIESVATR